MNAHARLGQVRAEGAVERHRFGGQRQHMAQDQAKGFGIGHGPAGRQRWKGHVHYIPHTVMGKLR